MESSARNRHVIRFRKPSTFKKPEYLECISPAIPTPKNAAKQMMISIYSKTIKRSSNSERKMNIKAFRKINNTITYDDEPQKCSIHSRLVNNNYMIKAAKQMQQIRRGSIENKISQASRECNLKINSTLKKENDCQIKQIGKIPQSNHCLKNHNMLIFNSKRRINEQPSHSRKLILLPTKPSVHKITTQSSTPMQQKPTSKKAFKNQHRILKNLMQKNSEKNSFVQINHKNLLNVTAPLQSEIKISKLTNHINKTQTISQEDEKCLKDEIAKLFKPKPKAAQNEIRDTPTRLSDSESVVLYDGCQSKPVYRDDGIDECGASSSINTEERDEDSHPIESSTPLLINYKCPVAPLAEVDKNENNISLNKLHLLNLISSNELDDMKSKIHLNLRKEMVAKSVRKNKNSFDKTTIGILNNPLRRRVDDMELNMNV